jgi:hypothetical protein
MHSSRLVSTTLTGLAIIGLATATPRVAMADTASTAAIIAGAAAITGALLYDANNKPYYVRDNRRYYVSQGQANYYRGHHHIVQRRAYVPENEYPVARDDRGHDHR